MSIRGQNPIPVLIGLIIAIVLGWTFWPTLRSAMEPDSPNLNYLVFFSCGFITLLGMAFVGGILMIALDFPGGLSLDIRKLSRQILQVSTTEDIDTLTERARNIQTKPHPVSWFIKHAPGILAGLSMEKDVRTICLNTMLNSAGIFEKELCAQEPIKALQRLPIEERTEILNWYLAHENTFDDQQWNGFALVAKSIFADLTEPESQSIYQRIEQWAKDAPPWLELSKQLPQPKA